MTLTTTQAAIFGLSVAWIWSHDDREAVFLPAVLRGAAFWLQGLEAP